MLRWQRGRRHRRGRRRRSPCSREGEGTEGQSQKLREREGTEEQSRKLREEEGATKRSQKLRQGGKRNSAVENRGSGGDGDGVILSSVVMVMVLAMWSMAVVMLRASFRFCDVVEEERKSARSKN